MDVRNETPFEHGFTIGLGLDRRPMFTVIVKATYTIPRQPGGVPELAEEQLPVLVAEEYYAGDVTGSIMLEADTVPFKPRADIALVGHAHAPGGQPAKKVDVLLRVGHRKKALRVFGDRQWVFPTRMVMIPMPSEPKPFVTMPLIYENAFGGFDRKGGRGWDQNFIGKGFLAKKIKDAVDGRFLPNIEDPRKPITSWDDEPAPAGFGFISPTWKPRALYVGSEKGMQEPHELFGLASDFRHEFFNGAHPDLQVSGYLRGDEEVELLNLTRNGLRRFGLPGVRCNITVRRAIGQPMVVAEELVGNGAPASMDDPAEHQTQKPRTERVSLKTVLDTLVILPDEGVFYMVWRGGIPVPELESDIEKITEIKIDHHGK